VALVGLLVDEALEGARGVVDAIAFDDFFAFSSGFRVGGRCFGFRFCCTAFRGELDVVLLSAGFGVGC
jgi:hypothetical protein